MPLIVEDGTIVNGANSYVNVVDCKAILTQYGYDIASISDEKLESSLYSAISVIEKQRYNGSIVSQQQALAFPRMGLYDIEGRAIASDSIPPQIIRAECFLAYEIASGNSPLANKKPAVLSESVAGAVSVTYDSASLVRDKGLNSMTAVINELSSFLVNAPENSQAIGGGGYLIGRA